MSFENVTNSSVVPTLLPTAYNWSTVGNWTNSSSPTAQPTSANFTNSPTLNPTTNVTLSPTDQPTGFPHAYNVVEDITNPKKFNFLALALSVALLIVAGLVTIYGLCQRYSLVRKQTIARNKNRRIRCSTPERWRLYFEEDVGSLHDANTPTRAAYAPLHAATEDSSLSQSNYRFVSTRVIDTSATRVN